MKKTSQEQKPIITAELQQTLEDHPRVQNIHFDAQGRHYFNVHKLIAGKKQGINESMDLTESLYGKGMFSHSQVIPGAFNVDGKTEPIAKGDPDTKIVKTMTREEILAVDTDIPEKSIYDNIASMTPDELAKVKAILETQSPAKPAAAAPALKAKQD